MIRLLLIMAALSISSACSIAQTSKREFRAAWIATVSNIDWPSKQGLPAMQQQQEFISRLDELKALGCNAVIVQIRPAADAFYASELEPWSRFLTGRQGEPPVPYYDPLTFMIEQAHMRQMEFHAWFNPFRALTDSKKNPNPASHVTKQHPDWIIHYGGKSYIDPGLPEARNYVLSVITDVVKRYDIDAVHLDDYFYPYPVAGMPFGDSRSFTKYSGGYTDRGDWRRNNVSLFIAALNTGIRSIKPYVKLGISPFGVWRNQSKDPMGSPTRGGLTNYDDLYADVLLWMKRGWIDYVLPQLYWEHGHRLVAFEVLMPWWEAHSYGRHVYYGLGMYRMLEAKPGTAYASTREIMWQLRDVRQATASPGFALYSASNLDKISLPIRDSIMAYNRRIAIPPPMRWLDSIPPPPPVVKAMSSVQGTLLRWDAGNPAKETARYLVYRFAAGERVNLERADRIISLLSGTEYLDADAGKYRNATYAVTALDRLWNESAPAVIAGSAK